MSFKDNTSDVGIIALFCVLTGAVVTIVGVILYYNSMMCYHHGNREKDACKPACCY